MATMTKAMRRYLEWEAARREAQATYSMYARIEGALTREERREKERWRQRLQRLESGPVRMPAALLQCLSAEH